MGGELQRVQTKIHVSTEKLTTTDKTMVFIIKNNSLYYKIGIDKYYYGELLISPLLQVADWQTVISQIK